MDNKNSRTILNMCISFAVKAAFIAVLIIALGLLTIKILPSILGLFDGLLSSFGNKIVK